MPVSPSTSHPGELTCTACGKPGAFAFDGEDLCADCCHERGSCCAEPPGHLKQDAAQDVNERTAP